MSGAWEESGEILLACARGLAPFARREAEALGFEVLSATETSVGVRGTLADTLRLNLWLRTAHRVLWPVARVQAKTLDHLYAHACEVPWERWLREDGYFTVSAAVRNDTVRDTRMPALRLKDAVADRLRERCGRRPDSGPEHHGAALFAHWRERDLRLYLDTSGEPLSRRGYRLQPGAAPLQETLAAACLLASGWDACTPLVLPMVGSGALAIEGAWMARGRPPGCLREHGAFMALRDYDAARWRRLREDAAAAERGAGLPPIVATDRAGEAVRAARENAARAGVGEMVDFAVCDFAETRLPPGPGAIVVNPEYGERLGQVDTLEPVYARLGAWLRNAAGQGYRTAVLTGGPRLAAALDLRGARQVPFFNGPLACRLLVA